MDMAYDPLEFEESEVFESSSRHTKALRGRNHLETLETFDSETSSVDGEGDFCEDPGLAGAMKADEDSNNGSHMSMTLRVVMEDELFPEMSGVGEDNDHFNPMMASMGRNVSRRRDYPSSMPVPSAINMGSSAPVNIPFMGRWKPNVKGSDSREGEMEHAATFIPPHQLSQKDDIMFSWTAQSPSMAMKKDRLKVRNQILKSTGYIEAGVKDMSCIGLQERNRILPALGGLSQALNSTSS